MMIAAGHIGRHRRRRPYSGTDGLAAPHIGAASRGATDARLRNRRIDTDRHGTHGVVAVRLFEKTFFGMEKRVEVGVVMGSTSDYEVMAEAVRTLEAFGVGVEKRVVSAHRTPDLLCEYAKTARGRGIRVIIAGAGGAAHLPGMVASMTTLPVVGVPVRSRALSGLDSLLSIVQMPAGVPVATTAIDGAKNAALIAVSILALHDEELAAQLDAFRAKQTADVLKAEL